LLEYSCALFIEKTLERGQMIKVQNLSKSFGPKVAVNNISFSLERGEVLGFLGPNGAGKSTPVNPNPPKKNLKLSFVRLRRLSGYSRGDFLAATGGESGSD
jgi:putative ribosome biogenesis GTPase RsgA